MNAARRSKRGALREDDASGPAQAPGTDTGTGRGPRQVQAAESRRRVLEAALAQFAAMPYDTVAIGAIADAAGVAHGLVFHYFGSKHGLYLEVMREVARQLEQVHAVPAGGDPGVRVRRMLTRHLRYMGEHQALALTLFRGGLGTDREAWSIIEQTRWSATTWICRELGLPERHPAFRLMFRAMAGAIDEATVSWIEQRRIWSLARLLAALMGMLAAALRGAATLEPRLDVTAAIAALNIGADAGGTPRGQRRQRKARTAARTRS